MNQNGFHVLAEIYRVLGQFDADSLAAASRLPGISLNLRRALASLSTEARATPRSNGGREESPRVGTTSTKSEMPQVPDRNGLRTASTSDVRGILRRYFSDPRQFPSKQSLLGVARQYGLELPADPKAGRARMIDRLTTLFARDARALDRLTSEWSARRDPQTSGWVDLIRRSRQ
jgi:hypothetical protein